MEQAQTLIDLWRMFWRRLPILIGIGTLGILASGFFAYVLPPVYESEAKILVESQQIPDELARSTVTASAAERLQIIQQRLMTRDNLLRLIQELQLFADRPGLSTSEKVDLLRRSTTIRPIGLGGRRAKRTKDAQLSAFTIKVTYNNPAKAAQIANEFVTTVLEQNLRSRSERASETLSFFTQEEQRLAQALSALEVEITSFKNENAEALPDSLSFRRDEIARLTESVFEIDRRALELEEKRGSLEASLEQLTSSPASLPAQSPEEQQLRQLEALLVQKLAIYAEDHREIRNLRAQIAAVEGLVPTGGPSGEDEGEGAESAQDPREQGLKAQILQLENQVSLLQDQKRKLAERRAELEQTIRETPNVEIRLNALYRRHAELQDQYSVISRKRTEAETGEKLEINRQAERFEVIENPIAPDAPVSPNRKKIVVLGSGASLALALGLIFLVEMLRPALRSAGQMERQLELRPVVTIPYIRTRSERRRRGARIFFWLLLIGGGIPAALYGIDQYVMPLELIGTRIAEKTGIDEIIRLIEQRF